MSHAQAEEKELTDYPVPTSANLVTDVENQQPATTTRSTAYLDGLRGIAALIVVLQHYTPYFYGESDNLNHGFGENGHYYVGSFPIFRLVYTGGHTAVPVFFVLSGYVLSRSPLRSIRERGRCDSQLISSVLKRPIRLYLPPMVSTLTYAILMHMPFGTLRYLTWPKPQESLALEIVAWLYEFIWFFNPFRVSTGRWCYYGVVMWTMPVELRGSMLIYGLAFAISRMPSLSPKRLSYIFMGSTVIVFAMEYWAMAMFFAGMTLSIIDVYELSYPQLHQDKVKPEVVYNGILFLGLYLAGQPGFMGGPQWALDTPGWHILTSLTPASYMAFEYIRFWTCIGAVLIVFSCRSIPWIQRFFTTRPLRYLGQVSFALYLTHALIYFTLSETIHRAFGQIDARPDEHPSWWDNMLWIPDVGPLGLSSRFLVCVFISLSFCMGVAHLGTIYLDQTSVRAGKWFAKKFGY